MVKRTMITNQQKIQIIEKASLEPTWTHSDLAHWATKQFKLKHTYINRSTVGKILKRADKIKSLRGYHLAQIKTKKASFPELERELVKWIDLANVKEISVTRAMIQDKAHAIARRLALPTQHSKFSNGWLWGFQNRFGIKSLADHGEAGSCNLQEVKEGRLDCQDVILQYKMRDVFNLDETALNYCMHSKQSHGRKGVKKGRKLNKTRIIVMLATNADGTDKLPLYFIGTAQRPRCFRGKTASEYGLTYSANQKGWMRTDLFQSWLEEMDARFRSEDRHILMLMDNASSHKTDNLELTNIRVHKLAPNTTPYNQPLDAGIIHSFKAGFRRRRDRHAAQYISTNKSDLYKVDVLTAMHWAPESWEEVRLNTIENCWVHTKIMPAPGIYEGAERGYFSGEIDEAEEQALSGGIGSLGLGIMCSRMSLSYLLL